MNLGVNLTSTIKSRGMSGVYLSLSLLVYPFILQKRYTLSCIYLLILLGKGNLKSFRVVNSCCMFFSLAMSYISF